MDKKLWLKQESSGDRWQLLNRLKYIQLKVCKTNKIQICKDKQKDNNFNKSYNRKSSLIVKVVHKNNKSNK